MSIGLGIYLGSIIFSFISLNVVAKANMNKAKREGYEKIKVKKSFSEKVVSNLKNLLVYAFPGVNVIYGVAALALNKEKLYNNFIENGLKKGILRKSEDALKKEAEEIVKQEKMKEVRNSLGKGKMGSYSTMSDEDKLEFLLDENTLKESYEYNLMTEEEQQEFKRTEMERTIESYQKNKQKIKRFPKSGDITYL